MEILLTTLGVLTIVTLTIIVGTGGKPMRAVSALNETVKAINANRGALTITALSVVVLLVFLYLFYFLPNRNMAPEQPIPFSHQLHSGVKAIDCYYCHPYVERSLHPGLPPVEKCLHCHNYIIANHPQILKEHAYYNTKTPTPWRKVFHVSEHVVFNHKRHIKKEVACESCHGQVREADRLRSHRFKMGFCIECHREKKAPMDCWIACHS